MRERGREHAMLRHLLDQGLNELARDEDTPLTREDLRNIADDAERLGRTRRGKHV